jgi:hypothetical protein
MTRIKQELEHVSIRGPTAPQSNPSKRTSGRLAKATPFNCPQHHGCFGCVGITCLGCEGGAPKLIRMRWSKCRDSARWSNLFC